MAQQTLGRHLRKAWVLLQIADMFSGEARAYPRIDRPHKTLNHSAGEGA